MREFLDSRNQSPSVLCVFLSVSTPLQPGVRLWKAVITGNEIAKEIVDAAFRIPSTLGPGLLESVDNAVLAHELGRRGLRTSRQQPIPVIYDHGRIEIGFRADLLVEDKVIVEIKSVEVLAPVHKKAASHGSPVG